VHAGQAVIGTDMARRLGGLVGGPVPADPFPDLTGREREILNLLASGAATNQIADRLGLSPKTVRNHLSSIFIKIEALDRTQAVLKARAAGLPRARES
jgi:DNA-binding NarL/FixJ family response regulator